MRKSFILLGIYLSVGCATEAPLETSADNEAKLAAALRGYQQSGSSLSCVDRRDLAGNRSAGDAIIFDGIGSLVYVNRPPQSCPDLRSGRALRSQSTSTQFCSGDIVSIFDPATSIEYGGCSLGDFTPYRRSG